MTRKIIQYPTPLSVQYATDVRVFDETLFALIEDLKDTINENNLDGLAAFQIGDYHNVIVVKDDEGNLVEMINPRLIAHKDPQILEETTAYYPNKVAKIQRYNSISVVFQDRDAKDCTLSAQGKFARVIQRKIDYTFGATFIQKMSKEERERFEEQLNHKNTTVSYDDYCPTTFKRDYLYKFMNSMLIVMLLPFGVSFFTKNLEWLEMLWKGELYTGGLVFLTSIVYVVYGDYEGKKFSSCTSCQIGNLIGSALFVLLKLVVLLVAAYFLIKPN